MIGRILRALFGSRAAEAPASPPPPPAPPPFVVPFTEGRFVVDPVLRSTLTFAAFRGEVMRIVYRGEERDVRPTGVDADYLTAGDVSAGGSEKRFRLDQIKIPGMAPMSPAPVPPPAPPPPAPVTFTVSVNTTIEETGDPSYQADYKPVIDPAVRDRLAKAVDAGGTVRIVYYGGHRPGSIRDVRPLSITPDNKLRATDLTEGIDKTLRLEKIALAPEGLAVTPLEEVARIDGEPARPEDIAGFTVEVMRRSSQQRLLARMVGGQFSPTGLIVAARCLPRDGVQVEIAGAEIGAIYSKYWWHYTVTLGNQETACRALITGPECEVRLDLALPPLDPELAPHAGASYDCDVVGESKYQDTLKAILTRRVASHPRSVVPHVMAALVADTEGGYRVVIDGEVVGALSAGNARRYLAMLDLKPETPPRAPAIIGRGGGMPWDSRGGSLYDVRLGLWLPTEMPNPVHGYRKPTKPRHD
ncbi:MAG TPA: hypothetical protein VK548_08445 [Candidatus Acidoferrum sp.]|nr:hypothetical protein [Candidatus Acidoferrum sp.]